VGVATGQSFAAVGRQVADNITRRKEGRELRFRAD